MAQHCPFSEDSFFSPNTKDFFTNRNPSDGHNESTSSVTTVSAAGCIEGNPNFFQSATLSSMSKAEAEELEQLDQGNCGTLQVEWSKRPAENDLASDNPAKHQCSDKSSGNDKMLFCLCNENKDEVNEFCPSVHSTPSMGLLTESMMVTFNPKNFGRRTVARRLFQKDDVCKKLFSSKAKSPKLKRLRAKKKKQSKDKNFETATVSDDNGKIILKIKMKQPDSTKDAEVVEKGPRCTCMQHENDDSGSSDESACVVDGNPKQVETTEADNEDVSLNCNAYSFISDESMEKSANFSKDVGAPKAAHIAKQIVTRAYYASVYEDIKYVTSDFPVLLYPMAHVTAELLQDIKHQLILGTFKDCSLICYNDGFYGVYFIKAGDQLNTYIIEGTTKDTKTSNEIKTKVASVFPTTTWINRGELGTSLSHHLVIFNMFELKMNVKNSFDKSRSNLELLDKFDGIDFAILLKFHISLFEETLPIEEAKIKELDSQCTRTRSICPIRKRLSFIPTFFQGDGKDEITTCIGMRKVPRRIIFYAIRYRQLNSLERLSDLTEELVHFHCYNESMIKLLIKSIYMLKTEDHDHTEFMLSFLYNISYYISCGPNYGITGDSCYFLETLAKLVFDKIVACSWNQDIHIPAQEKYRAGMNMMYYSLDRLSAAVEVKQNFKLYTGSKSLSECRDCITKYDFLSPYPSQHAFKVHEDMTRMELMYILYMKHLGDSEEAFGNCIQLFSKVNGITL